MVNYENSVKKPFTDLKKLAIGIIISFIPVVNWVSTGFALESSGLGKTKPSKNMPEWKNAWDLFIKGLTSFVIGFVYALPAVLVFMVGAGFAIASIMNAFIGTVVPREMISSVIAGESSPDFIVQLVSQNWYLLLPTLITLAPILLIASILMLLAQYMTPMAIMNYLKNKSFGKAFDMKTVFKKSFTIKYLKVWIIAAIVSTVAGIIFGFVPFIGSYIALFVGGVITYSMFGEVYREIKGK